MNKEKEFVIKMLNIYLILLNQMGVFEMNLFIHIVEGLIFLASLYVGYYTVNKLVGKGLLKGIVKPIE